jgi:hypothetical protein
MGGQTRLPKTTNHETGVTKGIAFKNEFERNTWLRNTDAVAKRVDNSGNIDIAGIKVHFGKKGADGQWETVNDLFKHVFAPDLEKSVLRGRTDAEALHTWLTSQAAHPPYPGASAADRLRAACTGTINGKPVVAGQNGNLAFGQGGSGETPFISRNQNAIAPGKRRQTPTLISEEALAIGKARYGERSKYPNSTLDNSHAEVAFMQKAYDSGLIKAGDSITIPVAGQKVRLDCVEHLPIMAEKTGIHFMTVIDRKEGIVYYWTHGIAKLKRLGLLP